MSPLFSINNSGNRGLRNVKLFGQFKLAKIAVLIKIKYLINIIIAEFDFNSFLFGQIKDSANIPSSFHSKPNGWLGKPCNFTPLSSVSGYSIEGYYAVAAFIICLFFPCRPTDVSRNIPNVVLDSVKGVVVWGSFSDFGNNVGNEPCSIGRPSRMHGYASPSISVIKRAFRVEAPILNVMPKPENIIIGASVFCVGVLRQTPAGVNPSANVSVCDKLPVATVTQTFPNRVSASVHKRKLDYGKPSESFSLHVRSFHKEMIIT